MLFGQIPTFNKLYTHWLPGKCIYLVSHLQDFNAEQPDHVLTGRLKVFAVRSPPINRPWNVQKNKSSPLPPLLDPNPGLSFTFSFTLIQLQRALHTFSRVGVVSICLNKKRLSKLFIEKGKKKTVSSSFIVVLHLQCETVWFLLKFVQKEY